MYPEDDIDRIQNSEEIEAISFEWTPELVKLATSRCQMHPYLGPLEPSNEWPYYIYPSNLALPDPADTRECLRWFGLADEKISEVEQTFNQLYPECQGPARGYEERFSSKGYNSITFPALDRLVKLYYLVLDHMTLDYEYTHEAYIKKGIQQGLRPEFAVYCGMHRDDPRCVDDPILYERDWFDTSITSIITFFTTSFWNILKKFLVCKLIQEKKAWSDERGQWLVHEGESIDQAKARVNSLDLQELREQALKEESERQVREKQEQDKLVEFALAEAEAKHRTAGGD